MQSGGWLMHTSLSQFVPAAYMPGFNVPDVSDLFVDSRHVTEGSGFVALRGASCDGRSFIGAAFTNGAVVAFADTEGFDLPYEWREKVIHIPGLESRIAAMAADFYGHPSAAMMTVAVTGTNGKTSVCRFVADAMNALHGPCGYIGTLGWGLDQYQALINTSPDVVSLHRILAALKEGGARAVALEASSIGLHQGRIDDAVVDVAVFTNLSRDHLDYHGDFESYAEVKRQLFHRAELQAAVINVDDPLGASWIDDIRRDCHVLTYSAQSSADVHLLGVDYRLNGTTLTMATPHGEVTIDVPVVGAYNAANLLATCAVLCHYSDDVQQIAAALNCARGVPGRMELVGNGAPAVLVDYAHTPDGLDNALHALRPHCRGRLVVVFGCGGDRDVGKRPLMAKAAENMADVLIVTSDNPRSEDPQLIIDDVMQGLDRPAQAKVFVDRREAIRAAITMANTDDCVLIAGKGHEDYQLIGDQKLPFDDCRVAAEILAEVAA